MNPSSTDIKDYLVSNGIGTFGTDIFIGVMPDSPDACVCLSDTAGYKPESRYEWDQPGLQVLVRAAEGGYLTAYAKIRSIHTLIHGLVNTTINTAVYKCIAAAHDPIFVGEDESNRPLFSINYEVQRVSA